LDFETFSLRGPTAVAGEVDGGACVLDALIFQGAAGPTPPIICGQNAGQHGRTD